MEENALDVVKIVVLLVTMPFWGPFVKALWDELNASMRVDGGLLGETPTPKRRKEIEAEMARAEQPQVHELLSHLQNRPGQGSSNTGRAPQQATAPPRPRGGPQPGPGRRPFADRGSASSRRGFR